MNTLRKWQKHTQPLLVSVVLGCFSYSSVQAATSVTVSNGFESGNLTGLTCSGNCPSVTTSPIKTGKYAGNFDLTPKMKTNYRTEAVLGSKGRFQFGKEYWIEFNYRYEDWAKDSDPEIGPFQIHTTPSSWNCNLGSAVGSAPFLMMSSNDEARFVTYRGKVLWRGPVQKKQWMNISVHFKISTGNDGFVEAWKDGVSLGRVNGANSPKVDICGKPMREPYFKMGVYKWNWQRVLTQSSRRQLFIDDLKITAVN